MINLLLLLIALLLSIVFFPIAFIYVIIKSIGRKSIRKIIGYLSAIVLEIALAIDRTGNVVCRDLFNDFLIQEDGYKFGRRDETISSALGKNKQKGKLKTAGLILDYILDTIDKDHSIKSIKP